jgi:chloramphenicol 3-O-phosphotransferase
VLAACSELLARSGLPHAAVCLSDIGGLRPPPADDEWNERVAHRNLASIWRNFADAGAERLLLERVLETRSLLGRIEKAVPGAEITVVRLRAPLAVLRERIGVRNARDPSWFLGAAEYLDVVFQAADVEDFAVDNVDRPIEEVAADVLRRAGWLA